MAPTDWTAEQEAIIDKAYNIWIRLGKTGKSAKHLPMTTSLKCHVETGSLISSQEIGQYVYGFAINWIAFTNSDFRYFHNRSAREEGRPRAQAKTSAQVAILRDSFEEEMSPYVGELILLTYATGLLKKQVKVWFENQRKKGMKNVVKWNERGRNVSPQDQQAAKRMWKAYENAPESYVKEIFFGKICPRTGDLTPRDVTAQQQSVWERWMRVRKEESEGEGEEDGDSDGNGDDDDEQLQSSSEGKLPLRPWYPTSDGKRLASTDNPTWQQRMWHTDGTTEDYDRRLGEHGRAQLVDVTQGIFIPDSLKRSRPY